MRLTFLKCGQYTPCLKSELGDLVITQSNDKLFPFSYRYKQDGICKRIYIAVFTPGKIFVVPLHFLAPQVQLGLVVLVSAFVMVNTV